MYRQKTSLIIATAFLSVMPFVSASAQEGLTRSEVEAIVYETLTQQPELLVEALRAINAQQIEARERLEARNKRIAEIAANTAGTPVGGNPDGDVTIVAFFDYNCEECREAHAVLDDFVKQDGNVRVVYRDNPILGENSVYAAKAALAADKQGKYFAFHDRLMGMDTAATVNTILKIALDSGVDLNRMMVDVDAESIDTIVADTRAISEEFAIDTAPAYFIGTLYASGVPTRTGLEELVQKARSGE